MTAAKREDDRHVVLAINAGSSTLKFSLHPAKGEVLLRGAFEGLEPGGKVRLRVDGQDLPPLGLEFEASRYPSALACLRNLLQTNYSELALVAVAHRIVHGGSRFCTPTVLDDDAIAYLEGLSPLAPLHQPHNLDSVIAFRHSLANVPQIGCFDTGFHATLPELERRLPLPAKLDSEGVRRHGFHGLSYQYVVQALAQRTTAINGCALLAHLGNGASVCATRGGKSIATSMGFSALDGLMMGTRSGSLDPGVLLYLLRQGWSLAQLEHLLYLESGLKGVSGIGADMRELRASDSPLALLAIQLFEHRLKRESGALIALLGGVDLIAFTGGIGEHDAAVRASLIETLGFLDVAIDPHANVSANGAGIVPIHDAQSSAEIWVVPTDEGRIAAEAAFRLLRAGAA